MVVHFVDGPYEFFRHFYGLRRFNKGVDRPYGAVVGVLQTVLQMIESGETHLGVATDRVIESFRNRLWAGYKTGAGIEPALRAQFHPLEDSLAAMGVVVWPMIDLEADDALASAAHLACQDKKVQKVAIWTPDKRSGAMRARHARGAIHRSFQTWAERMEAPQLLERCEKAAACHRVARPRRRRESK